MSPRFADAGAAEEEPPAGLFGEFMPCWQTQECEVASNTKRAVFSPADQEVARILSISAALWTSPEFSGARKVATEKLEGTDHHYPPSLFVMGEAAAAAFTGLSGPAWATGSDNTDQSPNSSGINIDDILIRDPSWAGAVGSAVTDSAGRGRGRRPGDWTCSLCGNNNYSFRTSCNRCDSPKPFVKPPSMRYRPGDWHCEGCGNENYSFRVVCNRCKTPKALLQGALADPGPDVFIPPD